MINRCICHNCSFVKIQTMKEQGQLLDDIIEKTQCGCGCGCELCQPYILDSYESGKTEYDKPISRAIKANQISPKNWQSNDE